MDVKRDREELQNIYKKINLKFLIIFSQMKFKQPKVSNNELF